MQVEDLNTAKSQDNFPIHFGGVSVAFTFSGSGIQCHLEAEHLFSNNWHRLVLFTKTELEHRNLLANMPKTIWLMSHLLMDSLRVHIKNHNVTQTGKNIRFFGLDHHSRVNAWHKWNQHACLYHFKIRWLLRTDTLVVFYLEPGCQQCCFCHRKQSLWKSRVQQTA